MTAFRLHLFGTEITSEDIVQTMQQFKGWEDRYRQVIQWGKKLPVMPEELKSEQVTVSGCESLVWLVSQQEKVSGISAPIPMLVSFVD